MAKPLNYLDDYKTQPGVALADLRHKFAYRVWSNKSKCRLGSIHGFSSAHRDCKIPLKENGRWPEWFRLAVVDHVKVRQGPSGFVSATLSFLWALWWARRCKTFQEKDIKISVISIDWLRDESTGDKTGFLAAEVLWECPGVMDSQSPVCEAMKHAQASRQLLVAGQILPTAVISTVAFEDILSKNLLPPWLRNALEESVKRYASGGLPGFWDFYARCFSDNVSLMNHDFALTIATFLLAGQYCKHRDQLLPEVVERLAADMGHNQSVIFPDDITESEIAETTSGTTQVHEASAGTYVEQESTTTFIYASVQERPSTASLVPNLPGISSAAMYRENADALKASAILYERLARALAKLSVASQEVASAIDGLMDEGMSDKTV